MLQSLVSKKNKPIDFERTEPDKQECKIIILHIINQAVKDYQHFKNKTKTEEIDIYNTANQFLFNDLYVFNWGEEVMSLRRLCDYISIDIDWLRNQVVKKLDLKFNLDGTIVPKKRY